VHALASTPLTHKLLLALSLAQLTNCHTLADTLLLHQLSDEKSWSAQRQLSFSLSFFEYKTPAPVHNNW
jgi:hypothetical protein